MLLLLTSYLCLLYTSGDYDAVITDFMLNNNTCDMSYQVDYTGEDIVRSYKKRCCLIPFFVLTAWAENATSEADDINHVSVSYTHLDVYKRQECVLLIQSPDNGNY